MRHHRGEFLVRVSALFGVPSFRWKFRDIVYGLLGQSTLVDCSQFPEHLNALLPLLWRDSVARTDAGGEVSKTKAGLLSLDDQMRLYSQQKVSNGGMTSYFPSAYWLAMRKPNRVDVNIAAKIFLQKFKNWLVGTADAGNNLKAKNMLGWVAFPRSYFGINDRYCSFAVEQAGNVLR